MCRNIAGHRFQGRNQRLLARQIMGVPAAGAGPGCRRCAFSTRALSAVSFPWGSCRCAGAEGGACRVRPGAPRKGVLWRDGSIPGGRGGSMVSRHFPAQDRREKWCERGESNPHGLAPGGFSYPLRLSPPSMRFGVWTIPSPCREHAFGFRCCPSSLYTFPEHRSGLGSGLPFHRFPRI